MEAIKTLRNSVLAVLRDNPAEVEKLWEGTETEYSSPFHFDLDETTPDDYQVVRTHLTSTMAVENGRHCIVTGGATVSFRELSDEVLKSDFLKALAENGFTHLDIQCGDYVHELNEKLKTHDNLYGLHVICFAFDKDLKQRFAALRGGGEDEKLSGCIVSHAASGTVLDVYNYAVPMIVVANPNLMDNHQEQFAKHVAKELPLVVHGHLGKIHESMPKIMEMIDHWKLDKLPPYEEPPFPLPEDQRIKIFDWLLLKAYEPDCMEKMVSKYKAEHPEKAAETARRVAEDGAAYRATRWDWVPRSVTRFFW